MEKLFDEYFKQNYLEDCEIKEELCCGFPLTEDVEYLLCMHCHKTYPLIKDVDYIKSYEPRILASLIYDRQRHFKNILYQLQGREIFHLKDIDKIKQYIKDNEITDLTTGSIKIILRNMKLTTYYLHIQLVRKHLGCDIIIMSDLLMERLCGLFLQIEQQLNTPHFPS